MKRLGAWLGPSPAGEWERFGRSDPYYGVYSTDEFRGRELAPEVRERFFASGERHVEEVLSRVRQLVNPGFRPERVLDYGCGVGRVLIPLARHARQAVGIDVSPSMLDEARRNCEALGVSGVELETPAALPRLGQFDLVHSILVLQHIPQREGERVLAHMIDAMQPEGVGVVQIPTRGRRGLLLFNNLMKLPLAHNALNLLRGRPWSYPHMQMNVYDLNRLLSILRARGFTVVHVTVREPWGGYEDCTLIFARSPAES